MTPKRKSEDKTANTSNNATSTERKKRRMDQARRVSVQIVTPQSGSANTSSMDGLPGAIDVEKFADARAYEINAIQESRQSIASVGTQRVWQSLPRHMRRRAASHDVRRVPARLRAKARSEMDAPSKPKKKLSQRGKDKRISRTEDHLRRQQDKTWLETHIWHAKRMHMENMWGYRLARTPTEKAFKPSHRASLHGCILHDASYEAIIELRGHEENLKEIFVSCSDPQAVGPGAVRFTNGSRISHMHMYQPKSYPFGLIGPIEMIWKTNLEVSTSFGESSKTKEKRHPAGPVRTVWIRCHPIIYDSVVSTIEYCIQAYLQLAQGSSRKEIEIEVADLRDQFNIFELVGPKSSQVIHGALDPVESGDREEFKKFWQALGQLQSAGSTPRGMIVGFRVLDPRLNFPPKNTKVIINGDASTNTSLPVALWPSSKLAVSEIWDEKLRANLRKPRYKKKDIDSRKSKHLVPGSKLNPIRQDDRVPVLLIQRSIEVQSAFSSSSCLSTLQSSQTSTRPLHGWTIIVPKGWGMSFFSSLSHTGTRVGGQNEIATQRFEAGCAIFPKDYPCTKAHLVSVEEEGKMEKERWERKPPAKRPNWKNLGTNSPWVPDWDGLLGAQKNGTPTLKETEPVNLVPTQREVHETDSAMEVDVPEKPTDGGLDVPEVLPWLFRGPETSSAIETLSHSTTPSLDLLARINKWRGKRSLPALDVPAELLYKRALVNVRLDIPRSGTAEDGAIIYKVDDDEAIKWRALIDNREGEFTEQQLSELKCSKDAIVGYVTSGHYSLSIGRGQAIGAISLAAYLEVKEQLYRTNKVNSRPLVKARNKDSPICRATFVDLIT